MESGLHYNGHRYYSPLLRIYTQADRLDVVRQSVNPVYARYGEPMDLQRGVNQAFSYSSNNPLKFVDPLGLMDVCPANMRPGPDNTCQFDPGTNSKKECKTADCAAERLPHRPDCRAVCVADFANPIPDAFTEAGIGRLGKAKFGEATGLLAKDLFKKFNKAKGAYDLASCLEQCKKETTCTAE